MPRTLHFFLLLLSAAVYAQGGTLRGVVVDATTGAPVEFATISVLDPTDSTLLSGGAAGGNGEWELESFPSSYPILLRASFIGYEPAYRELTEGEATGSPIRFHLRTGAQLLREVEVTGKALTDVHRLDRQAFDAEQFRNAQGGTATDVLRNLPAVSVGALGEISVRGSTGFLLMIDGKPVQTDPATVLDQLPANAITKVELITTPGAKYDPDGQAGIINITTTGADLRGWSVTGNLNYGLPAVRDFGSAAPQRRYAADVGVNYRDARWDVGAGLSYQREDDGGLRVGYVNTLLGNRLTELPSVGERSHDRENYSGRLSVGYTPDRHRSLRANLFAGKRTVFRTADILYRNQRRALVDPAALPDLEALYDDFLATGDVSERGEELDRRTFFNENLRVRRGDFFIASLDYERSWDDGDRALSVSSLYESTLLGGPTDNLILDYPELSDTLQYQYNTNDNPLDGYRFNVDYRSRLGAATWESGYQFRYLRHPGDFLYLDRTDEGLVINPEFTNGILLRRDVHSLYSQLSGGTERLEYSAGLRLEYFDRSVALDRPDTTYRLDRLSLYPSANLKYALAEGWSLKAGYSRRIDRTTTFKMTPFPEREHNETLEQGDAELLPELTDLVEAGLVRNFGDNSAFGTVYYRRTRDVINRVNTVYNDTILNRIYTNVGNAEALGLELALTVFPVGDWRLYLGGNLYRYRITGRVFGDEVNTGNWVYTLSATTDVNVFDLADLQLGFNYLSERVTAQGRDSRFFTPYLNLRREFADQRLAVTFQWQSISLGGWWGAGEKRITTVRDNFFTTTNYVYETDILRLGVSYRFTKLAGEVREVESEFGGREF